MSISDKITRLQTAKTNIATAITNKGGTVNSGDGFEDFADKIASLSSAETETPNTITANGTYTATSGKYWTGVTVNVPQGTPIEISTDEGMSAVLTAENVGKAYKFTGTTGAYTNGDIYIVEES